MSRYLIVAAALLLFAGTPALAPSSFDPDAFAVGKPAPVAKNGNPSVVVLFASWCLGCVQELPTVIKDYTRFKDRVNFIGVDYLDNSQAGAAMIAKYQIPFPVFALHANADAPPPVNPDETPRSFSLHLQGLPPSQLSRIIPGLAKQLPAEDVAILKDVANACAHLDDASCRSYALSKGVDFGSPRSAPPATSPRPSASTSTYLTLPHLFVIDAGGIVRSNIEGYTRGSDDIARELAKLGIH